MYGRCVLCFDDSSRSVKGMVVSLDGGGEGRSFVSFKGRDEDRR